MSEAMNGAPSAPAGVAQPSAAPPAGVSQPAAQQQPSRRRLSDMEVGLEQANERRDVRAVETERRLARPDTAQAAQVLDPELPTQQGETENEDGLEAPPLEEQPSEAIGTEAEQKLLAAFKEWTETGSMPDQLLNMRLEWVDEATGVLRRDTIRGLQEGNMRQSKFSQSMGEVRQREQQVQQVTQNINTHFERVRDPDVFLQEYEDRGYDMDAVAERCAARRRADRQIAQAAGLALMQQEQLDGRDPKVTKRIADVMEHCKQQRRVIAENRRLQQQNAQLAQMRQQQDSQAQQQVRMQQLGKSVGDVIPTAFKATGVRNTPKNQENFWKHLNAYVATLPGWDGNVRRQHCVTAARMVREELEDLDAMRKPTQQSRAMPPRGVSASGTAQPAANDRKRVSDMQNDGRFGFG